MKQQLLLLMLITNIISAQTIDKCGCQTLFKDGYMEKTIEKLRFEKNHKIINQILTSSYDKFISNMKKEEKSTLGVRYYEIALEYGFSENMDRDTYQKQIKHFKSIYKTISNKTIVSERENTKVNKYVLDAINNCVKNCKNSINYYVTSDSRDGLHFTLNIENSVNIHAMVDTSREKTFITGGKAFQYPKGIIYKNTAIIPGNTTIPITKDSVNSIVRYNIAVLGENISGVIDEHSPSVPWSQNLVVENAQVFSKKRNNKNRERTSFKTLQSGSIKWQSSRKAYGFADYLIYTIKDIPSYVKDVKLRWETALLTTDATKGSSSPFIAYIINEEITPNEIAFGLESFKNGIVHKERFAGKNRKRKRDFSNTLSKTKTINNDRPITIILRFSDAWGSYKISTFLKNIQLIKVND